MDMRKVIKAAGGATKFAAALGTGRSVIYLWKQVPAERLIEIERITGVPRDKLRPDLFRGYGRVQTRDT